MSSMHALEGSLARDGLRPVYVLLGDARPLVEEALAKVVAAALPAVGLPAFNHTVYRATEDEPGAAFRTARTLPMMADRRLVVVREIQEGNDLFWENFVEYLKGPSPECTLVAVGTGFPKVEKGGSAWGVRVKKALDGVGTLLQLDAAGTPPLAWVSEVAARRGKAISRGDAELLVEIVGVDLARLAQEVDKLALYVGDAPAIDADAIAAASSMLAEAEIWDLTAGIATADADAALGALHRLQDGGDDPRRLLSMIVWQYREILRFAELVRAGVPDSEIRHQVRMRDAIARKVRDRIARGMPGSAEVLRRLSTAHRDMNSHRAGDQRVLEALVLEMVTIR